MRSHWDFQNRAKPATVRVTLKTEKAKPVSRNRAPDETKRNLNRRAAREPDLPSKRNETETEPRVVSLSFRETDKMLPRKMHQSEERIYSNIVFEALIFTLVAKAPHG